jgi:hypothetical protein
MKAAEVNSAELFSALDNVAIELIERVTSVSQQKINLVPFKHSWTPAQLAIHVTKSNRAIAQGLLMKGHPAERNPDAGVQQLKKMFLDFNIKYESPQFIVPEEGSHDKEEIIVALKKSIERLRDVREKINLSEIISLPPFGEVTKLELLHFVLYHTTRHIHQLKNILNILQSEN